MTWEGKTLGEICNQIKDPSRNGGRSLGDLVHHIGMHTLVGLGLGAGIWTAPGAGHAERGGRWSKPGSKPGQLVRGSLRCGSVLGSAQFRASARTPPRHVGVGNSTALHVRPKVVGILDGKDFSKSGCGHG